MVKLDTFTGHKYFKPFTGAVLAVLCGLALWKMPGAEGWIQASYDYLFRFGAREVTNKVVIILMDNAAYDALNQTRAQFWDRHLHAKLLEKLTADECPLVVFDVFFKSSGKPETDAELADAIRKQGHVVLMTRFAHSNYSGIDPAEAE